MTADDKWLLPWLRWLDRVEALAGRTQFPEDPQLEGLHAWFKEGRTAAYAVHNLPTLKGRHAKAV